MINLASGFKITYSSVMLVLKNFILNFFKEMMTGHPLEEAVPGQKKLNVGTSGSEWCKGWMTADTLSTPLTSAWQRVFV